MSILKIINEIRSELGIITAEQSLNMGAGLMDRLGFFCLDVRSKYGIGR